MGTKKTLMIGSAFAAALATAATTQILMREAERAQDKEPNNALFIPTSKAHQDMVEWHNRVLGANALVAPGGISLMQSYVMNDLQVRLQLEVAVRGAIASTPPLMTTLSQLTFAHWPIVTPPQSLHLTPKAP